MSTDTHDYAKLFRTDRRYPVKQETMAELSTASPPVRKAYEEFCKVNHDMVVELAYRRYYLITGIEGDTPSFNNCVVWAVRKSLPDHCELLDYSSEGPFLLDLIMKDIHDRIMFLSWKHKGRRRVMEDPIHNITCYVPDLTKRFDRTHQHAHADIHVTYAHTRQLHEHRKRKIEYGDEYGDADDNQKVAKASHEYSE